LHSRAMLMPCNKRNDDNDDDDKNIVVECHM